MHFSLAKLAIILGLTAGSAIAFSGDMTYYYPGLGSCGETNGNGDAVVALSESQPGNCNRNIKIHYNGKVATAKVVDACPGCSSGSIDELAVRKEVSDGTSSHRKNIKPRFHPTYNTLLCRDLTPSSRLEYAFQDILSKAVEFVTPFIFKTPIGYHTVVKPMTNTLTDIFVNNLPIIIVPFELLGEFLHFRSKNVPSTCGKGNGVGEVGWIGKARRHGGIRPDARIRRIAVIE
ncbi:hypothetical protein O1611_g9729 [Lasiodiplodia mahajangana]|uniref:Uncharacterized protein n=1 Tax=Lasiodiplodia mahajangana TaxID=1108764 RepID=A0ACC2J613_9PEZI|nr:hypothetical protein O1611_g9729 [Lasiodiplodia mahajangana]